MKNCSVKNKGMIRNDYDLHHQQHQQQHGRKTINSYDPNSFSNKKQNKNIRKINPKAGSFHKGKKIKNKSKFIQLMFYPYESPPAPKLLNTYSTHCYKRIFLATETTIQKRI